MFVTMGAAQDAGGVGAADGAFPSRGNIRGNRPRRSCNFLLKNQLDVMRLRVRQAAPSGGFRGLRDDPALPRAVRAASCRPSKPDASGSPADERTDGSKKKARRTGCPARRARRSIRVSSRESESPSDASATPARTTHAHGRHVDEAIPEPAPRLRRGRLVDGRSSSSVRKEQESEFRVRSRTSVPPAAPRRRSARSRYGCDYPLAAVPS